MAKGKSYAWTEIQDTGRLSIYLFINHLSIYLSIHPSIWLPLKKKIGYCEYWQKEESREEVEDKEKNVSKPFGRPVGAEKETVQGCTRK
jgi:hypothetical protein